MPSTPPVLHSTLQPQLGKFLKKQRVALRMGLRAVEEKSGVSKGVISRIERGAESEVSTLRRIAEALGWRLSLVDSESNG